MKLPHSENFGPCRPLGHLNFPDGFHEVKCTWTIRTVGFGVPGMSPTIGGSSQVCIIFHIGEFAHSPRWCLGDLLLYYQRAPECAGGILHATAVHEVRDSIQNTNDCQIAIVCPPGMLVSAATRARFSIKNNPRGNNFYRRIQMIARLL